MRVTVRRRVEADAAALALLLAAVHEQDDYPVRASRVSTRWLLEGVEPAWVAEVDGRPVGHAGVSDAGGSWELTRFFVAVDARGSGAGSALLDEVDAWADAAGAELGLVVMEHNTAAQALYERRGWRRTGSAPAPWASPAEPWLRTIGYRRPAAAT